MTWCQTAVIASRVGGRFPPVADPKPRWSPQAQSPIAGPERQGSATERARAGGSAIREARARSRGCSHGERYEATVRTRSILTSNVS